MSGSAPQNLRILIIGAGRMGQAVEQAARSRGHDVVAVFGRADVQHPTWPPADVAIEFTSPESAVGVMAACRERQLPLVSGTTGWDAERAAVEEATASAGHALVWASNFSRAVYLFRKALASVSDVMRSAEDFTPSIHEVHHTGKRDAPSGTAKTLAEDMAGTGWPKVSIAAERLAGVPGTHSVDWRNATDSIQLRHSAFGRHGFAHGAVGAAEWLVAHKEPHNRIFGPEDFWG